MKKSWLASRTDIFVRALFEDFFASLQNFSALAAAYRRSDCVDYARLEDLVGTDMSRGRLWQLKDLSHLLCRSDTPPVRLQEQLFDWALSTLFHEAMKLKENVYLVERHRTLRDLAGAHPETAPAVSRAIAEYDRLLIGIREAIARGIDGIAGLFVQALDHLRALAPQHRGNLLLVRFLLEQQAELDAPPHPLGVPGIIGSMFPGGMSDACSAVAADCLKKGWRREALAFGTRALEHNPGHRQAGALMDTLRATSDTTD
jgi:hypothetical protein